MVRIGFKRLRENAKLPKKAHARDAGYDVCATEDIDIAGCGGRAKIPIGLAAEIPMGFEIQVRPRGGLAVDHGITVLNSPGTIDENFKGEICVILINHGEMPYLVMAGDRIAQLVIARVPDSELFEMSGDLTKSDRGSSGFGDSGYC